MRPAQPSSRSDSHDSKRRVLVVDDHPIVRQGLTMLINREPDLMVCGEAEEMHSAMEAIAALRPDIVLLDISLGGPDGLELLKQLRARDDDLPVLILSMHDESIYAERVLRAGANGYIMKQEATELVLTALRRILAGQVYVPDRVAARMLGQYVRGSTEARSPLAEPERPRARGVQDDRRRQQHEGNCRGAAPEHQDRRVVPGAHQREAGAEKRARASALCHRVEARRDIPIALSYQVNPDALVSNFP